VGSERPIYHVLPNQPVGGEWVRKAPFGRGKMDYSGAAEWGKIKTAP
jgi:hypothetical protein